MPKILGRLRSYDIQAVERDGEGARLHLANGEIVQVDQSYDRLVRELGAKENSENHAAVFCAKAIQRVGADANLQIVCGNLRSGWRYVGEPVPAV